MSKYQILKQFEDAYVYVCDIVGDNSTTNITLNKLCKKIFGNRFIGVFCADETFRLRDGECCIINTDPTYKSGVHWCSLYKYRGITYFFDSFGRHYTSLSKYWKYKRWSCVEFKRIESFKSENCGELSVSFLVIFDRYKTKCIGVI